MEEVKVNQEDKDFSSGRGTIMSMVKQNSDTEYKFADSSVADIHKEIGFDPNYNSDEE